MNRKSISTIMALAIAMSVGFTSVYADSASDTAKIKQVQAQRNDLETKVEIMDNQIETIMSKINSNKNSVTNVQKNIKQNQLDIAKAEANIKSEEILFNKRMRAMYMSGSSSYVDIILGSNGVDDFISRLENVKKIVKFDQNIIDDMKTKKTAISLKKVTLNTENTKLLSLRVDNKKKLATLSKQKSNQTVLISQLNAQESQYGSQLVTDQATATKLASAASKVSIPGQTATTKQVTSSKQTSIPSQVAVAKQANTTKKVAKVATVASQSNTTKKVTVASQANATKKVATVAVTRPSITANQVAVTKYAATPRKAVIKKTTIVSPRLTASRGSSTSSNAIIAYASNFLGVPYVWGGTSPSGFDCSGFTQYVFAHFGVNLPRVTQSQQNVGTLVSRANLQAGDLVFFGTPAYHVGIYVGNGNMIAAPHTGDVVKIQKLNSGFTYGRRVN
ncbi:C40 family peptidase [Clostridium psychrophilum]|uniref:C40 family peptidase n=1 Tax=Clostridium psychrophilum TaxID=132926 RepID=UPI001C0AB7F6|nr:C40 family peptidase [Clostridium psychrophilum]MBU3181714.1 C40 family peptidase [Clostridium psychrophilum]